LCHGRDYPRPGRDASEGCHPARRWGKLSLVPNTAHVALHACTVFTLVLLALAPR
jgi:hypothetical protein